MFGIPSSLMGKEKKVKTCSAYSLTKLSVASSEKDSFRIGADIHKTSGWVFLQT